MTAPTIDRATLDALKETTGAEFAMELVETFLKEAPAMMRGRRARGQRWLIWREASSPSISGICTSISTTS